MEQSKYKAKVFTDVFNGRLLIEEGVEVTKLSPAPIFNKNGEIAKNCYPQRDNEYDFTTLLHLYNIGIRVANVRYSNGTIDHNVWIRVIDLEEVK